MILFSTMTRANWMILQVLLSITVCNCMFINVYPKLAKERIDESNLDKPLILTPLIRAGKIKEAQALSQVTSNEMKGIRSFSGYFTVNEQFNSNMFFWFFPSRSNYNDDPVLLWLQGGPGATSLFGLFMENGPFIPEKHGTRRRQYAWTENHSVIYIDNPVGTGYSFTNDDGYSQNQTVIGENLYAALLQFFQLFPEIQKNDFFVTGESYAGKYVPAISYTIHKNNPTAKQKINLKGLAIGNGFSDPVHQLNYGDYLYQIGLIDANVKAQFDQTQQQGIKYIESQEWEKAFRIFDGLIDGDLNNHTSIFKNSTGFSSYFYYLSPNDDFERKEAYFARFIQSNSTRAALHVGNVTFETESSTVEGHLMNDIMQSVAPWISELLNHYKVLVYNGQLDIIVAYPLTVNYLQHLNFSGAEAYKTAPRYHWYVDNELAGYAKHAGNLTEVLVRNAGHMVPTYQPRWAFDLINRFTREKKLY